MKPIPTIQVEQIDTAKILKALATGTGDAAPARAALPG